MKQYLPWLDKILRDVAGLTCVSRCCKIYILCDEEGIDIDEPHLFVVAELVIIFVG